MAGWPMAPLWSPSCGMGGLTSIPAAPDGVEMLSVFLRFFLEGFASILTLVGVCGMAPLGLVGEAGIPVGGWDGHCGTPSAPGWGVCCSNDCCCCCKSLYNLR